MRTLLALLVVAAVGCGGGGQVGPIDAAPPDAVPAPDAAPAIELIGHNDLGARGMNAALALAGDYAYIGSRGDGVAHANAGVKIVDVSDPASPQVVGEIGPPDQGLIGMSSRELRALPDQHRLYVLNIGCAADQHACGSDPALVTTGGVAEFDNIKIYDISAPTAPVHLATHDFGSTLVSQNRPHEFFLWRDPADPARILLYVSTPAGPPSLTVLDVSDPSNITTVAAWDGIVDAMLDEPRGQYTLLHSLSVSDDGRIAYLAHMGAGFFMVDTSDIADGVAAPAIRTLTPIANRVDYSINSKFGTHSAVAIPGRNLVLLTDEIYPYPIGWGCPWGWARIIDVEEPLAPFIAGEFKTPQNVEADCVGHGPQMVAYTGHNPTVTEHLALISWYSSGLQIVDTAQPNAARALVVYLPEPLPSVEVEDPFLGGDPVLMWSYPIVRGGLIYVVDARNGLYILRYSGPHEQELSVSFLEGNSNLR